MNPLRYLVGFLARGISPSQGLYTKRTTQEDADIFHALSGIPTHDPRVRGAHNHRRLTHCDHRHVQPPLFALNILASKHTLKFLSMFKLGYSLGNQDVNSYIMKLLIRKD
jgi:hypothetical protein